MFEKVNPSHPDKVADRIAGAMVDLAYQREKCPRVAVEVLIGHGHAYVIAESSVEFKHEDVQPIIDRICGEGIIHTLRLLCVPQDKHLADNQEDGLKCGDNGIFKGMPVSEEERELVGVVRKLYMMYPTDGKFIINDDTFIVCQSNFDTKGDAARIYTTIGKPAVVNGKQKIFINPLGDWTGGLDTDCGATNRKLGSDMGRAVTGGGLHGKDLSKADVSVNIVCHILAQQFHTEVTAFCAIGDKNVAFNLSGYNYDHRIEYSYPIVVAMARGYISEIGGFEKLAEWGLVR